MQGYGLPCILPTVASVRLCVCVNCLLHYCIFAILYSRLLFFDLFGRFGAQAERVKTLRKLVGHESVDGAMSLDLRLCKAKMGTRRSQGHGMGDECFQKEQKQAWSPKTRGALTFPSNALLTTSTKKSASELVAQRQNECPYLDQVAASSPKSSILSLLSDLRNVPPRPGLLRNDFGAFRQE